MWRTDMPDSPSWDFFLAVHSSAIWISPAGSALRAYLSFYACRSTIQGQGRIGRKTSGPEFSSSDCQSGRGRTERFVAGLCFCHGSWSLSRGILLHDMGVSSHDDYVPVGIGGSYGRYRFVGDWPGVWWTASHAADDAECGPRNRWSGDIAWFAGGSYRRSLRSGGGDVGSQAATFPSSDRATCWDLRFVFRQPAGRDSRAARLAGERPREFFFNDVCSWNRGGWILVVCPLAVQPVDVQVEARRGVADDLVEVAHGEVVVADVTEGGAG